MDGAQARSDAAKSRLDTELRRQKDERLNLDRAYREERRLFEERWASKVKGIDECCADKLRVLSEARRAHAMTATIMLVALTATAWRRRCTRRRARSSRRSYA